MDWNKTPVYWWLEVLPGYILELHRRGPEAWHVAIGSDRLPETFATPEDAASAALDFARRRLYEALAKLAVSDGA